MKRDFKVFFAGVLATVLVFSIAFSPLAEGVMKTIQVKEGGINIYVDGKLQTPTDANGNKVFPLVYNGTTYLPVRALTGMLTDKNVAWDASTQSIKIGATSQAGQEVRLNDFSEFTKKSWLAVGAGAEFVDFEGKPVNAFNAMIDSIAYPYESMQVKTEKQYSAIKGKFVLTQEYVKESAPEKDLNLTIYGKEQPNSDYKVLQTYKVTPDKPRVDVNVDIAACTEVSLVVKAGEYSYPEYKAYAFHNIVFVKK
ncbi:MAG: hypothetical protein Q4A72_08135 [Bacillota bacterium]|nr:hypothetical protein [Bacillota bacterium]